MSSSVSKPKRLFVWVGVLVGLGVAFVWFFGTTDEPVTSNQDVALSAEAETRMAPERSAEISAAQPVLKNRDAGISPRDVTQDRLREAQDTLETYRKSTQYPPHSRPAKEHPDTMRLEPLVQSEPLSGVGESAHSLNLSQDRHSVVGDQPVKFELTASNGAGCRVTNSWLSSVSTQQPTPNVSVIFNELDPSQRWAVELSPTALIASDTGIARLTVQTACAAKSVELFADVLFNREAPAVLGLPISDQAVDGSLLFTMTVEVKLPGRYLLTARLDDAQMQGFAYLQSDSVLPVGKSTVKFEVFGKLITDSQPRFPLKLRDIEGFLLRENMTPDRLFIAPLLGYQHASASYDVSRFSNVEWQSEQRTRYLNRLGQQVDRAQREVDLKAQNR